MTKTIVGHFSRSDDAGAVLAALEESGWTREEVSYLAHDGSGRLAEDPVDRSSGTVKGGAVALALPGVGPVVAAGPIAAALAGEGAAAGGLFRALGAMGVPEEQSRRWAGTVSRGGALVFLQATGEKADRVRELLAVHGADSVREHDAVVQESGGYDPADPHSAPVNYGEEGGSSQWGQTVLRVDDDEAKVAQRTFSRDRKPKRLD